MLAAPSLRKRPTKVPNLKSLRPLSSSHARVKGFLSECTVLKVVFHQNIPFAAGCVCVHFSARKFLQAGTVKGLTWISLTCDGSLYTAAHALMMTADDFTNYILYIATHGMMIYDDDDDDSSLTSVGFACASWCVRHCHTDAAVAWGLMASHVVLTLSLLGTNTRQTQGLIFIVTTSRRNGSTWPPATDAACAVCLWRTGHLQAIVNSC